MTALTIEEMKKYKNIFKYLNIFGMMTINKFYINKRINIKFINSIKDYEEKIISNKLLILYKKKLPIELIKEILQHEKKYYKIIEEDLKLKNELIDSLKKWIKKNYYEEKFILVNEKIL